jgi:soluble P-type ATPase
MIEIPGRGKLLLKHLVLDYNGTLAFDGALLPGVSERLEVLSRHLHIHVITADTFGLVGEELKDSDVTLKILSAKNGAEEKEEYVIGLGSAGVVAMGNGYNDRLMLKRAELGVAILGHEGAASQALLSADIVIGDIQSALDLLLNPQRLAATLRA